MLTSKRFAMTQPMMAFDVAVKHRWIPIPAGSIIRIVEELDANGDEWQLVELRWEGRPLIMFAIDLFAGCIEMKDQRLSA
jgi:hypothetical protein